MRSVLREIHGRGIFDLWVLHLRSLFWRLNGIFGLNWKRKMNFEINEMDSLLIFCVLLRLKGVWTARKVTQKCLNCMFYTINSKAFFSAYALLYRKLPFLSTRTRKKITKMLQNSKVSLGTIFLRKMEIIFEDYVLYLLWLVETIWSFDTAAKFK